MASDCPPQLHLSLPSNTTSFKRSFEQFGFDLDSPVGGEGPATSATDGNDRNKRARSASSFSDDTESSESTRSSSSASPSSISGDEMDNNRVSALSATRPPAVLGTAQLSLSLPRAPAEPPRLPTPDIQDVEMSDFALVDDITPATNSPIVPATSQVDEGFRASLERFNAFDSHISALRRSLSPPARTPTPPPILPPLGLSEGRALLNTRSIPYLQPQAEPSSPLLESSAVPRRTSRIGTSTAHPSTAGDTYDHRILAHEGALQNLHSSSLSDRQRESYRSNSSNASQTADHTSSLPQIDFSPEVLWSHPGDESSEEGSAEEESYTPAPRAMLPIILDRLNSPPLSEASDEPLGVPLLPPIPNNDSWNLDDLVHYSGESSQLDLFIPSRVTNRSEHLTNQPSALSQAGPSSARQTRDPWTSGAAQDRLPPSPPLPSSWLPPRPLPLTPSAQHHRDRHRISTSDENPSNSSQPTSGVSSSRHSLDVDWPASWELIGDNVAASAAPSSSSTSSTPAVVNTAQSMTESTGDLSGTALNGSGVGNISTLISALSSACPNNASSSRTASTTSTGVSRITEDRTLRRRPGRLSLDSIRSPSGPWLMDGASSSQTSLPERIRRFEESAIATGQMSPPLPEIVTIRDTRDGTSQHQPALPSAASSPTSSTSPSFEFQVPPFAFSSTPLWNEDGEAEARAERREGASRNAARSSGSSTGSGYSWEWAEGSRLGGTSSHGNVSTTLRPAPEPRPLSSRLYGTHPHSGASNSLLAENAMELRYRSTRAALRREMLAADRGRTSRLDYLHRQARQLATSMRDDSTHGRQRPAAVPPRLVLDPMPASSSSSSFTASTRFRRSPFEDGSRMRRRERPQAVAAVHERLPVQETVSSGPSHPTSPSIPVSSSSATSGSAATIPMDIDSDTFSLRHRPAESHLHMRSLDVLRSRFPIQDATPLVSPTMERSPSDSRDDAARQTDLRLSSQDHQRLTGLADNIVYSLYTIIDAIPNRSQHQRHDSRDSTSSSEVSSSDPGHQASASHSRSNLNPNSRQFLDVPPLPSPGFDDIFEPLVERSAHSIRSSSIAPPVTTHATSTFTSHSTSPSGSHAHNTRISPDLTYAREEQQSNHSTTVSSSTFGRQFRFALTRGPIHSRSSSASSTSRLPSTSAATSVRNIDPNSFGPGPFRNTMGHAVFGGDHTTRVRNAPRAAPTNPPWIPPLPFTSPDDQPFPSSFNGRQERSPDFQASSGNADNNGAWREPPVSADSNRFSRLDDTPLGDHRSDEWILGPWGYESRTQQTQVEHSGSSTLRPSLHTSSSSNSFNQTSPSRRRVLALPTFQRGTRVEGPRMQNTSTTSAATTTRNAEILASRQSAIHVGLDRALEPFQGQRRAYALLPRPRSDAREQLRSSMPGAWSPEPQISPGPSSSSPSSSPGSYSPTPWGIFRHTPHEPNRTTFESLTRPSLASSSRAGNHGESSFIRRSGGLASHVNAINRDSSDRENLLGQVRARRLMLARARQSFGLSPFDSVGMHETGHGRRVNRNLGDYIRDDEFDSSYENLLMLSTTLGEVRPRNTPEHVIASMETGQYKDWKTSDSDERCPICLDDYQPSDVCLKLISCPHWLHRDCLKQWLKNANTCPVCRQRVGASNAVSPPVRAGSSGPRLSQEFEEWDSEDDSTSSSGGAIPEGNNTSANRPRRSRRLSFWSPRRRFHYDSE